jgi:hypothetical protein
MRRDLSWEPPRRRNPGPAGTKQRSGSDDAHEPQLGSGSSHLYIKYCPIPAGGDGLRYMSVVLYYLENVFSLMR